MQMKCKKIEKKIINVRGTEEMTLLHRVTQRGHRGTQSYDLEKVLGWKGRVFTVSCGIG